MWSKTKKALEERLPPSLRDHIKYRFERYTGDWGALTIRVDGEIWHTTNVEFNWECGKRHWKLMRENGSGDYWTDFYATEGKAVLLTIRETGFVSTHLAMKYIHQYLNVYNIQECLSSENCFLFLLAMFDRRLGKRNVKKIYKNIEVYPDWLHKYIQLRAAVEGITLGEEEHRK